MTSCETTAMRVRRWDDPCARRRWHGFFGVCRAIVLFLGLSLCSTGFAQFPITGLRDLEHQVKVGTVVSYYDFGFRWDDGRFLPAMKREYSIVTAPDFEWSAPWDEKPLRPARDVFDFTVNDATVAYIESAELDVRGHASLHANWPPGSDSALPSWLTQGNWTRDQAIEILREHIVTVVGRYRGRVKRWAVVNEGVLNDGTLLDPLLVAEDRAGIHRAGVQVCARGGP